jgi:hypothetical protein
VKTAYSLAPTGRLFAFITRPLFGTGPRHLFSCGASFATALLAVLAVATVQGAEPRVVTSAARTVGLAKSTGRLAAETRLNSVIALPLRDRGGLSNLLAQICDPANPNFRHYLTAEQFAERFGPTKEDYEAVKAYARANGLAVTGEHANRTLLDVSGAAGDIEKSFHVRLNLHEHPTEARTYYAPDTQPALDLAVPILAVHGLDNFKLPRPLVIRRPPSSPTSTPSAGSGTGGAYVGKDFRAAYVPGVQLTGAGQTVGLFELDGYYPADIANFQAFTGFSNVAVQPVLLDGVSGQPSGPANSGPVECALDIEMAISMAPGLARVLVYEGNTPDDILNQMATDNQAKQMGCSWEFGIDEVTQQIFQQFAAQGQSFFTASGDTGGYAGAIPSPGDSPFLTVVGGTVLSTLGPGRGWVSEATWSETVGGTLEASGGGISTIYPIPAWQQGVSMLKNGGSTAKRNLPDVAMVAENVEVFAENGNQPVNGTSVAAPLWAGFAALANQQAVANGGSTLGFLNPALYAIGKGSGYSSSFHDITVGHTTSQISPRGYFAEVGYDLCTGWGTPTGSNLINALVAPPSDPLLISPELGFFASGPSGGPYNVTSQVYSLTNAGTTPLQWSLVNTSVWLNVSASAGSLAPGDPAASVEVSLSPAASRILIGSVSGNIWFTNTTTGVGQNRQFFFSEGNGGFETGDFTDWTVSGISNEFYNVVLSIDDKYLFPGMPAIPGIDDGTFVHSGSYGAFFGENGSVAELTQTLSTTPGASYLLSFWLADTAYLGTNTPNEFVVGWGGTALYRQSNLPVFGWTNMQFIAKAAGSRTVLEFASRNDPAAFGFDDVSVLEFSAPVFQSATQTNGSITLVWTSTPGVAYQVQSKGDLSQSTWSVATTFVASGATATASFPAPTTGAVFYRVVVVAE